MLYDIVVLFADSKYWRHHEFWWVLDVKPGSFCEEINSVDFYAWKNPVVSIKTPLKSK